MLVVRLMALQGIEVIGLYCTSVFHEKGDGHEHIAQVRKTCLDLGAGSFVCYDMNETMMAFTSDPHYGYGKHLNACLDCRLAVITVAAKIMQDYKADFIVSGEVIGQRPMSQRRDAIDRLLPAVTNLGLEGLLLRPLSAKLFGPTMPEVNGWVDRDKLYDFSGRTRSPQIALASELGITNYPTPAGGCLLTDKGYSSRLRDLMQFSERLTLADIKILRIGRHYRINANTKIVVSRNESEEEILNMCIQSGDMLYSTKDCTGALVLVRGVHDLRSDAYAAFLATHYSKDRGKSNAQVLRRLANDSDEKRDVLDVDRDVDFSIIDSLRVNI